MKSTTCLVMEMMVKVSPVVYSPNSTVHTVSKVSMPKLPLVVNGHAICFTWRMHERIV